MTSLTGLRWLASICLALVLLVVVEISKWIRRRQADKIGVVDARRTSCRHALANRPLTAARTIKRRRDGQAQEAQRGAND